MKVHTKRSVVVHGHKTSVSLEDHFWEALRKIATARGAQLCSVLAEIDRGRGPHNLSSAIRLFVLDHYRTAAMAARNTTLPAAHKLLEQRRATTRHAH
jgi:predicted DNA-binding ribbon-helix-helix protein